MIHLQFKSRELQTHSNYNYDGTLRTTGEIEIGLGDDNKPNSIMVKTGLASKAWNLMPVTFQAGASKASDAKPILTINGLFK
jgi:hypothetical protein